mgnify:CR=1 FL=1
MFKIETPRLTIIQTSDHYLNDYYREFTPEITKYQYPEPFSSLQQAKLAQERFLDLMAQGKFLELVITDKEDNFLGSLQVFDLSSDHPEIGIWLKDSAHNKGYGYEALSSLLDYLNQTYFKESYTYEADLRNTASLRLVRRFKVKTLELNAIITASGKRLYLQKFYFNK